VNTTVNISLLLEPYRVENFASVNFRQTGKELVNPCRMTFRCVENFFFGVHLWRVFFRSSPHEIGELACTSVSVTLHQAHDLFGSYLFLSDRNHDGSVNYY